MLSGNERGGIEKVLFPLMVGLRRRGWQADLAILRSGSLSQAATDMGLQPAIIGKKGKLDLPAVWELIKLIRRGQYQLVHTHSIGSNFYGRLSARVAAVPLVTTVHADTRETVGDAYGRGSWRASSVFRLDLLMAGLSSRLVVFSHFLQKKLIARRIKESRLALVRSGIGPCTLRDGTGVRAELQLADTDILVTTIGRLVPIKNQALLIEAAKLVVEGGGHCVFLIVGTGPLKGELQSRAKELEMKEQVRFLGWRDDVDDILAATDVFVMSSSSEGLSLVTLEAMAQKTPVVATDVGALGELVVPEKTGILVPPDDERLLAEAIIRLARSGEEREQMGEAGQARVASDFALSAMVEDIEGLYEDVLRADSRNARGKEAIEREENIA